MKYSEKELDAIIKEVEGEFGAYLKKAEAEQSEKLQKSEEIQPVEKTEEFDYDEEDFEEMHKMYSSMTKAEKEAHYSSVKKALFGEESSEPAVEKTENLNMIAKSEFDSVKEQNEELKKNNEELKKNMEKLTSALAKFVKVNKAPKQKSITEIAHISKNESEGKVEETKELSKTEIKEKLSVKIRNSELSKSDREAINNFYLKNTSVETIKHLL